MAALLSIVEPLPGVGELEATTARPSEKGATEASAKPRKSASTTEGTRPKAPSQQDRVTINEFVGFLEVCGFCRQDSPSHDRVMPFNRYDGQEYSHAAIDDRLSDWLKATSRTLTFREIAYIVACLPLIKGTKFRPGDQRPYWNDPRTGTRYGNGWTWYVPQSARPEVALELEQDLPLVAEYFRRLAPIEYERRVLIQWIAHILQRPGERPSWHIMIPSEPGTGKGFLVQHILHPLLNHTMVISSYGQLTAQFSPVLESSLLVLLDDCKSKSDATQTRLKSILSEERQYVEAKQKTGGMVNCFSRFILASNEDRPLCLEVGERRWFVLRKVQHEVDLRETQQFIQKLADWLALPGSLDKLYHWLMSVDLSEFNPKAVPESDGLALMIAMSKSPVLAFVEGYVREFAVFERPELGLALREHDMRPAPQHLKHLLREVGYEASQFRLRHFKGKQKWVCHPIGWNSQQVEAAFASIPVEEPYHV